MFDKRTVAGFVIGAYVLAALSRVLPALSPSAIAGYLPSFGGDQPTGK